MRRTVAIAAALAAAVWAQDTKDVSKWIASHAIPLSTPVAGNGFDDMQPLKKVVGDARIVALGEATHGSREFFQLKHRMLEFLVTQMGFRIFSIEANMPEAYRLNDYVLNGDGDPAALLKGMYFWTWDTEEVLDMIHWMREYNKSGRGRVEFTGFDMQTPDVAAGIAAAFAAKFEPEFASTLRQNIALVGRMKGGFTGVKFGLATGIFPVDAARGKKIKFSGWIRAQDVTEGYAGLWWRVDGPSGGVLAFDNMQQRGVKGTTDWKEYSIELPVAENATNINFGALFPGQGTAWFDDWKIEIDGQGWEDPSRFDLGFESEGPKGFYTGGEGYAVTLDSTVFHGGKQSLRMRSVERPPDEVDPATVIAAWKDAVAHLEGAREAYRAKGAGDHDIDWAIQNARVVLQCVQMKAGTVTRDRSMAENVKWIADHSPDAKIVLWAHNGHVQAGGQSGGGQPMGAALRGMFGAKMVVFGFAFNQGSFQAMSQRGLRDFTVPPAPPGSLNAVLASASMPLFALDLRQIPAGGTVAEWWKAPHPARSIGAVYREDQPDAFMVPLKAPEAFDAMLFVEKTAAARKNGPLR